VKRLSKGKPGDVDKLLAGAIGHPQANYVKGMARYTAGQLGEARKLLDVAAADYLAKNGHEHVRARYRLALIATVEKKYDEAKKQLALLFAASPEHVRGRALEARITAETGAAAAAAPDAGTPAATPTPTNPPAGSSGGGASGGDAYDGLVEKGNAKAENGDCGAAMPLFERALDVRPGGVEALTGLGYCHLDHKEYGRAQASFRAALGISPRYGDAIIGLAEAYRFQGQNQPALEAYQRYLDANPNGPKAEMARRQVKNLSSSTTPAPEPAPAPAPSPPPDKPAEPPAEGTTVPEAPPSTPTP
jgi:tetratricopeptide (TPR) repeat protein